MELPEYEHEWVVVSDGSGKTVTMRYLATVEYSGKTYFVLSNTENEDTFEFADERHPVLLTVLAHGSHDRGVGEEYYYNIAQMQTFVEIGLAEAERESK